MIKYRQGGDIMFFILEILFAIFEIAFVGGIAFLLYLAIRFLIKKNKEMDEKNNKGRARE